VPPDGVEVAVLGPVAVRGAAAPFRRSAARELVVYLAFHRRGATHAEWALALWPDRPVALPTVHSTASDARRALGRAPDGTEHLLHGTPLRLGDTVTTDVARFASLAGGGDPGRLMEAFGLVRGPLFAGLRHPDWSVFDGTHSEVEQLVVQAALRGADELAALGRGNDAAWVVRRALKVSPYDERLYRALLRATAAQGNRVGLRSALAELLTLAGEAPAPATPRPAAGRPEGALLGCLHPETADLYRALRQGPAAAGGHPARL
jgi:DNA-binding SARP family transcriptional activator